VFKKCKTKKNKEYRKLKDEQDKAGSLPVSCGGGCERNFRCPVEVCHGALWIVVIGALS